LAHVRRSRVHIQFAEISIKPTESGDCHPKHLLYRLRSMFLTPAFSMPRGVYLFK
jgi:hypothetical protein